MDEPTEALRDPAPAEPSAQSARLLRRLRRRGRLDLAEPRGLRLAAMRALVRLIAGLGRVPRTVRTQRDRYGAGGTGLWVVADSADPANGALLFLHGGGFLLPPVHKAVAAGYSALTGLPVFLPSYRRAPEHPFPAAADDVLGAYTELLHRGFPASAIRLAGDSSGGFLATALLGDIERAGLPMPAAVLLVSPLVDLSAASAYRCDAVARDPSVAPRFIEVTNKAYAAGTPLTDPRLDVLAADKRRWPPVLIQTGGTECLTGENEQLAASIRAAGGHCELQIAPGQVHAYPHAGGDRIPEARLAREYAARFLATPPG